MFRLLLKLYLPRCHCKKQSLLLEKEYVGKVINTSIQKNTIRKLTETTCEKTACVFDNEIYEQIDGVSMEPLVPVLANTIMTEIESIIIISYLIPEK